MRFTSAQDPAALLVVTADGEALTLSPFADSASCDSCSGRDQLYDLVDANGVAVGMICWSCAVKAANALDSPDQWFVRASNAR